MCAQPLSWTPWLGGHSLFRYNDETLLRAMLHQVLHPLSPRAKTSKHSASRLCSVWNRVSLSSFWPAAPQGMRFSLAPAIQRHQQRYDLPSRQVDVVYRRLEPRPAVRFAFEFSREKPVSKSELGRNKALLKSEREGKSPAVVLPCLQRVSAFGAFYFSAKPELSRKT